MAEATQEQLVRINEMFLNGTLGRTQLEEVNALVLAGRMTEEVFCQISEGTFKFRIGFSGQHLAQVRNVWERIAREVLKVGFEEYLYGCDGLEAIPMLPTWPEPYFAAFDRDVLVDGRVIERIGMRMTCRHMGLIYEAQQDFPAYEPPFLQKGVRWIRAQAGHKNRGRTSAECRQTFANYEIGMTVEEGVFTYINDPRVIDGHILDLPGSVHFLNRDYTAYLGDCGNGPEVYCGHRSDAHPAFGSGSRGK